MRKTEYERMTKETQIKIELDLDGTGQHEVDTGVGFLDHMLTQIAVHGLIDLKIKAAGDLHIDPHHLVEDCALVLGTAIDQALGDRSGIVRMASAYVPMDESLGFIAIDLSGRPYAVVQTAWQGESVGGLPTSLIDHFFESLAVTSRSNLHARVLYGRDNHHQAEALFKALGRSLYNAVQIDPRRTGAIPSSKGRL
jgi:imidazoleglycerol-phosphate dehydratase